MINEEKKFVGGHERIAQFHGQRQDTRQKNEILKCDMLH